jgi:flavodoxin
MKVLVVFYSRTGNTRRVAQEIMTRLQCDSEELRDQVKRTGFLGYIRSGRQAMKKEPVQLDDLTKNIKDYDLVIVGTPIWAFTMSTPIRTFLEQNRANLPEIAFFTTSGSSPGDKTFSHMQEVIGKVPKATLSVVERDLKTDAFKEFVTGFVQNVQ